MKKNNLAILNPELALEWHPNKNGVLTPYDVAVGSDKKVWWQCKNCNHEWEKSPLKRNLVKKIDCEVCASLEKTHPKLASEWHPIKNGDLTPLKVTHGSKKEVWWECKECNYEWRKSVLERKKYPNCPYCSNSIVTNKNSLQTFHPELTKEWHPTKNGDLTPNDVTYGSKQKVWWKCSNENCNHEWESTIYARHKGGKCHACIGFVVTDKNSLQALHPELVKEWNPTKNGDLTPNDVTYGSKQKVWWKCSKCNHEWEKSVCQRVEYPKCFHCNSLQLVNPELAKEWHLTKNGDLTPNDVACGSRQKVWWKCLKEDCSHEWEATVSNRNGKNSNCPACSNKAVTNKNCLQTTNPVLAKEWHLTKNGNLTPKDVTYGSVSKVWWKCSKCNHEWKTSVSNRSNKNTGTNCPSCKNKTSFPEKTLFYYLKQIFEEAKSGKKIEGTQKEMDISIFSLKLAIEYDGQYYHQDIVRDQEKDRILHEKGWSLIRIREKDCPPLINSTSIQYIRKTNKNNTLSEALYYILQIISSRYPLTDIQLQKIKNLSVDIQRDRDKVKRLMAS